ncbi:aldehyde dehydrogenase family protein [Mucilaginibacter sp.]|jgi:aldehyde dehydrogenase (NAD+)|uniref:aldehyde dehydrogenase family protein n=1 Tax=Mucilaginibacter sp. TaxID=1882438 RepID=UPI003567406D
MKNFQAIFEKQKAYFNSDITKSYEWRVEQLDRMEAMLTENFDAFCKALGEDFKTGNAEQQSEINGSIASIRYSRSQLSEWMKPVEVSIPKFLSAVGGKGMIYRDPYGVALIIGPFNGPIILLVDPAASALAAGNNIMLKVSSGIPAVARLWLDLVPKYFEEEAVSISDGDREEVTELLKIPYNFIFFTGSVAVGKVIMRAAAENLTPVLLELGGQNPAIIDHTANIAESARKIVWGAMAWGGQWCTSPGYAYVHESVVNEFNEEAKKAIIEMYGDDPKNNPDYSKIINVKAVKRLASLIDPQKVIAGGDYDEDTRYFAPTLVYPASWSDKIMEDEIFGPILAIMPYSDLKAAVNKIKGAPKPLAAYIFSKDENTIEYLKHTLSFGGGAVNHVNIQLFIQTLPFGGVGSSGIGSYYGKFGFDSLSHPKSVLGTPTDFSIEHLYPPYTEQKIKEADIWGEY